MVGSARRFILTAEGDFKIRAPRPEDIAETAAALCPQAGCGFMILEEDCPDGWGDYVQAAGGRDAKTGESRITVERRVYVRDGNGGMDPRRPFQHLVAGRPGQGAAKPARIETNSYQVTVRANEVLSTRDVVAIMTAFLARRELPSAYGWRSNREEVEETVRETEAWRRQH
ncbi:hypothetical protein MKK65_05950 [Methylobacterium sp. J-001]|nr:hypothetical protein [Methylobacterium sp. J-001]